MQATLFEPATQTAPAVKELTRQDIERIIYSNGGGSPATIIFHEDPGHGWLQVPHSLLKSLKIDKKISRYSYRDTHNAYLEEDCDLSTFMAAIGIKAGSQANRDFWSICEQVFKEDTPIRNKKHY